MSTVSIPAGETKKSIWNAIKKGVHEFIFPSREVKNSATATGYGDYQEHRVPPVLTELTANEKRAKLEIYELEELNWKKGYPPGTAVPRDVAHANRKLARQKIFSDIEQNKKEKGIAETYAINSVYDDYIKEKQKLYMKKIESYKKRSILNQDFFFGEREMFKKLPVAEQEAINKAAEKAALNEVNIKKREQINSLEAARKVWRELEKQNAISKENVKIVFNNSVTLTMKKKGLGEAYEKYKQHLADRNYAALGSDEKFGEITKMLNYASKYKKVIVPQVYTRFVGKTINGVQFGDIHDSLNKLANSKIGFNLTEMFEMRAARTATDTLKGAAGRVVAFKVRPSFEEENRPSIAA